MFEMTHPKSWIILCEAHWQLPPVHTSTRYTFVSKSLPSSMVSGAYLINSEWSD